MGATLDELVAKDDGHGGLSRRFVLGASAVSGTALALSAAFGDDGAGQYRVEGTLNIRDARTYKILKPSAIPQRYNGEPVIIYITRVQQDSQGNTWGIFSSKTLDDLASMYGVDVSGLRGGNVAVAIQNNGTTWMTRLVAVGPTAGMPSVLESTQTTAEQDVSLHVNGIYTPKDFNLGGGLSGARFFTSNGRAGLNITIDPGMEFQVLGLKTVKGITLGQVSLNADWPTGNEVNLLKRFYGNNATTAWVALTDPAGHPLVEYVRN